MSEHEVCIASPPDRVKLVAMINFDGEQWAEINRESDELIIELYPRRDGSPWSFALAEALTAIDDAKHRLIGDSE